MKRFVAYGVLAVSVVLSSCGREVTAPPKESRLKWGWDKPHATGQPAPPSMTCTPSSVAFGGTVTCTLTGVGPMGSPSWNFSGGNVQVTGPTQTASWAGPMITSGSVTVEFDVNGVADSRSVGVSVNRRTSWSWISSVGGSQGTPGVIDICMTSSISGLTASVNCTSSTTGDLFTPRPSQLSSGTGYTAGSVAGSGPNGGLWYVNQRSASMDLRTQVHRDFRSDGVAWAMSGDATVVNGCATAFPGAPTAPRNIFTVNNACVNTPAFSVYVGCVWSHEGQHLSAAMTSAQSAPNDVYALWEPLVAPSSGDLHAIVSQPYTFAHDRVFSDALAAHGTMTPYQRTFWYTIGGGWGSFIFTQSC